MAWRCYFPRGRAPHATPRGAPRQRLPPIRSSARSAVVPEHARCRRSASVRARAGSSTVSGCWAVCSTSGSSSMRHCRLREPSLGRCLGRPPNPTCVTVLPAPFSRGRHCMTSRASRTCCHTQQDGPGNLRPPRSRRRAARRGRSPADAATWASPMGQQASAQLPARWPTPPVTRDGRRSANAPGRRWIRHSTRPWGTGRWNVRLPEAGLR